MECASNENEAHLELIFFERKKNVSNNLSRKSPITKSKTKNVREEVSASRLSDGGNWECAHSIVLLLFRRCPCNAKPQVLVIVAGGTTIADDYVRTQKALSSSMALVNRFA